MKQGKALFLPVPVLIVFTFFHAESWGADWREYAQTKEADVLYYDADSIRQVSKDKIQVWEKRIYSSKGAEKEVARFGEKYRELGYSLILCEIDCAERTLKLLQANDYSRNGENLGSFGEVKIQYAVPDSVGEDLLNTVCKRRDVK
jgi:hypothetical protein